ncbi:TonB-dependent receptor plug domain-containing protein [Gracilimonas mengyeensis]|uniref:TonB-dependent outer membrane receptor, SusC/RagA subfamily, signature region n=1 Tax=Gracilimonas mengyeensis TaxID=1302730 RepID=A0A521FB01_9BACT|nr:TonB-dependent receptor plug domain-containing protein [Gracilimonas mengyeensis]SMO93316.1 TonB-dependent outer membrane receptor, SusC/RagA subfamily, signature region [Gracilimonas mengyeensis]
MKTINTSTLSRVGILGSAILFMIAIAACSSTNKTNTGTRTTDKSFNPSAVENVDRSIDLTTHLRRIAGVRVNGDGPYATVRIRNAGVSSFNADTTPLFVVDGQIMNISYSQLYNMVNAHPIAKIEVLKGAEAGIYGARGANGAIVITSKFD